MTAAPRGGSRGEVDSCIDCHSATHEDYLILKTTSHTIPASIDENGQTVSLGVDVSANNADYCAGHSPYFTFKLTVEATCANSLVSFGSAKVFDDQIPPFNQNVGITATGVGNGADVITLTATLVPKTTCNAKTVFLTEQGNVDVTADLPPVLSDGKVTPVSGDTNDEFVFEVTYVDSGNTAPSYLKANINGNNYDMGPKDGTADTFAAGEVYQLIIAGETLGVGTQHQFSFSSSDGTHPATGDITTHDAPDITQGDRLPTLAITNPAAGTYGGPLTIKGSANDLDATDDITKVEIKIDEEDWVQATGTTSWSHSVDLYSYSNGQMTIAARAYNGRDYSPEDSVTITIDNDLENTPPVVKFDLNDDDVIQPVFTLTGTIVDSDLPNQAITVYAGLDIDPVSEATFKEEGGKYVWSLDMDLSNRGEGRVDIYAKAEDPYSTSSIERLSVILDKPNELPTVSINPISGTLTGTNRFSGLASDPNKDDILEVEISFDENKWITADLDGERWTLDYDVSKLSSGENTIYAKVSDGYAEASASLTFEVQGPPAVTEFGPESPLITTEGDSIGFWAKFSGVESDDLEAKWILGASVKAGSKTQDTVNSEILFEEAGEYSLLLTLSNINDESLTTSNEWKITVYPAVNIEPKGEYYFEVDVDEPVTLEFVTEDGEVKTTSWLIDGNEVSTDETYTFTPDKSGLHEVKVLVTDEQGNSDKIVYNVNVADDTTSGTAGTAAGSSSAGLFIMIAIIVVLLLVGVVAVILAVMVKKKKTNKPVEGAQQPQAPATGPAGAPPQQNVQQQPYPQQQSYPGQQPGQMQYQQQAPAQYKPFNQPPQQ